MHIGFDISQTGAAKAGCGFYAHAAIESLVALAPGNRYRLYPSFGDFYFDPLMPLRGRYRGPGVEYGPRHWTRGAAAAFWNAPGLWQRLGAPDIVHANNFWCPERLDGGRLVYTLYDLGFLVQPAWAQEYTRQGSFQGAFRASLAADWIVAISEHTRRHYLATFPHFPAGRIRVIPPVSRFDAAMPARRPAAVAPHLAGGFWLSVGTLEPRKNQRRLVEAYARYRALGGAPMPLVLAGGKGWHMEDFAAFVAASGVAGDVIMAGYVSDAELAWLYRNCHANLYPSLFEGFGLPVLEALQFGAACLVSSSSSLPEVAGDAAVLVAPEDTEAWARAMLDLSRDPARRDGLRERAPRQAARFDRVAATRALLALYDEAVRSPPGGGAGDGSGRREAFSG